MIWMSLLYMKKWNENYQSLDETWNEALDSQSLLKWWWNSFNACTLYKGIFDVNYVISFLIYFTMSAVGRTEAL